MDKLNKKEIIMIGVVLNKLGKMSANTISNYSHKDIPWIATEDNQVIDYRLVFL
jgi:hypothetical protein